MSWMEEARKCTTSARLMLQQRLRVVPCRDGGLKDHQERKKLTLSFKPPGTSQSNMKIGGEAPNSGSWLMTDGVIVLTAQKWNSPQLSSIFGNEKPPRPEIQQDPVPPCPRPVCCSRLPRGHGSSADRQTRT
jgi:hypothetical protein